MVFTIGSVSVRTDGRTIQWVSGMEVDADGAFNCYSPANSGLPSLDALANAGKPGNYYGLSCDAHGIPYIQGSDDPSPGFYISSTALFDATKPDDDPRKFVNASTVPYIAVSPSILKAGARKGDLCVVKYAGKTSGAIIADVGPNNAIGEGSIALCQRLGVDPFRGKPKHHLLGINGGVSYTIYLGTASTPAWPRPQAEIDAIAASFNS